MSKSRQAFHRSPFTEGARADHVARRGMSLIELLLASTVMAMIAGAAGALAVAVNTGSQYSRGQGVAVQHARVALDRIQTACLEAHASAAFPGFLVVPQQVGEWTFPDTLVVWRSSAPADPEGLPRYAELAIYTPDPASPRRLLEITAPGDHRTVPAPADIDAWRAAVATLMERETTRKTQLTNLVRTPRTDEGERLAAVRFHVALRPSEEELAAYRSREISWGDVSWAQSVHGGQVGLRQAWCQIELQLTPRVDARANDPEGNAALTFFGSAAIYYGVTR